MDTLTIVAVGVAFFAFLWVLGRRADARNYFEPLDVRAARRHAKSAARSDATRIVVVVSADETLVSEIRDALATYRVQVASVVVVGSLDALVDMAPDVVVVHVEASGLNGFIVAKKVRKTRGLEDVGLVIVSSDENAEEIFVQHAKLQARADAYVTLSAGADAIAREIVRVTPLVAR